MICATCAKERAGKIGVKGDELLPRGWKLWGGAVWCDGCWSAGFVCRAIAMPVLGPLEGTWEELREALRIAWGQARSVANVTMTTLYAAEPPRGQEKKMPPLPKVDIYGAARRAVPEMPSASVATVTQTAMKKYAARRYETVWTGGAALASHRFPQPYPVKTDGYTLHLGEQGEPVVALRLGDRRWKLQLRRGAEFARQYKDFVALAGGEARRVEMAIYRKRVGGDGGRNDVIENGSRGTQRVRYAVMCKIVGYFARRPARADRVGVLSVATGADCLLFAIDGAKPERVWWHNCDHARRWAAEHSRYVQRASEDRKAEIRMPVERGRQLSFATGKRAQKYANRMATLIDQASASLVKFAERRRIKSISYDDTVREYIPKFQYFALKAAIERKAGAAGIEFEYSGNSVDEVEAPLPGAEPGGDDA